MLRRFQKVRFNSTQVTCFTELESRWTKLPEAEQGAIADKLYELQKGDWKKMTLEEKRAVKPKLITHTKEWKEAEAEMLIEQKQNPFHGPYGEYLAKQQVK